jgi:hypothetical protein
MSVDVAVPCRRLGGSPLSHAHRMHACDALVIGAWSGIGRAVRAAPVVPLTEAPRLQGSYKALRIWT